MTKRIAGLLWIPFAAVILSAQTATTGLISGTVTDPSGAAVPAATVEIANTATGVTQQAANEAGQYVFPGVVPGEYTLKATAPGFRSASVTGIRVEVTKSYVHDVRLEVGQLTEVVEVTAETAPSCRRWTRPSEPSSPVAR